MTIISRRRVIGLVFAVLLAISLGYLGLAARRAGREITRSLDSAAKPLPTKRLSRRTPASVPAGEIFFPHASNILDIAVFSGRLFAATDVGLALVDREPPLMLHRGNGLPATALTRLAVVENELFALASEGLLRFRAEWSAPDPQVGVDLFSLADPAPLLDLAVDGGRLWLLDAKGRVLQFGDGKFALAAQLGPIAAGRLTLLAGRPVVGTAQGDLWLVEGVGDVARRVALWPPSAGETAVLSLTSGADGALVGTPGGLWQVDRLGATLTAPGTAASAATAWGDELWIGGPDGSLRNAAGEPRFALGAPIHALRADGDRLLVGAGNGLWLLEKGGAPAPAPANAALQPLGEGYVTALAALSGGDILAGGLNRGLWRLSPGSPPARSAGLNDLGVNRLVPSAAGGWWAATTNGLFELDSALSVRRRLTDRDGLPHRYVASAAVDEQRVAIATSSGLAQLSPAGMRAIDAFHGLAGNHLYCLTRYRGGLAAGGLAGLTLLGGPDGLTPQRNLTGAGGGLPHNWVNALIADGDRLLIGTYGGGIVALEADGQPYAAPESAGVSINPEAGLHYGDLYLFGTLTRGLAVSRDGRRWRFSAQGLLSPNVTALGATADGLWVGADCGLVRLPWELVRSLLE